MSLRNQRLRQSEHSHTLEVQSWGYTNEGRSANDYKQLQLGVLGRCTALQETELIAQSRGRLPERRENCITFRILMRTRQNVHKGYSLLCMPRFCYLVQLGSRWGSQSFCKIPHGHRDCWCSCCSAFGGGPLELSPPCLGEAEATRVSDDEKVDSGSWGSSLSEWVRLGDRRIKRIQRGTETVM